MSEEIKALAVGALALAAAACANNMQMQVPAKLAPPANESLAMIVPARGVQIYECRAKKDGTPGYEWAFVAPEAELFDNACKPIGRHGAGPYWQAVDGSRVTATVKERADAPVAGAIPWLLLTARPGGPDGTFSKVSSIQRVNTVGGVAPATGCAGGTVGTPVRVAYTADYHFSWRNEEPAMTMLARALLPAAAFFRRPVWGTVSRTSAAELAWYPLLRVGSPLVACWRRAPNGDGLAATWKLGSET